MKLSKLALLAAIACGTYAGNVTTAQAIEVQQVACDCDEPICGCEPVAEEGSCDAGCDSSCDGMGCGLGLIDRMGGDLDDPFTLFGSVGPYSVGGWLQLGYHSNSDGGRFNSYADHLQLQQAWIYAERAIDASNGWDIGGRIDYVLMNKNFTIAVLVGVVHGQGVKPTRTAQEAKFHNYMAQYNKSYSSPEETAQRMRNFQQMELKIEEWNYNSARSGKRNAATFGTNMFSDLTEEEFIANYTGFREEDQSRRALFTAGQNKGRGLVAVATTVDWSANAGGQMTPVKNQGGCGSCWAFAVTTQLEGAIAIKRNAAPSRLSEQQLVDCMLRQNQHNINLFGKDYGLWGCDGGWMRQSWEFIHEQGAMQYVDYPYTSGSTGVETICAHDWSKVSQRGNLTIGRVYNTADALAIVDQVPMTIAVDASGAFQSYRSGVMNADSGCGTGLNHAVTVVGYTAAGDDGTNPPDPEPPGPEPVDDCTVHKWWHTCTTPTRRLADANGYDNYWKVQNSWGSGWGDQGFILLEITQDGPGICGMHSYMEYAMLDN